MSWSCNSTRFKANEIRSFTVNKKICNFYGSTYSNHHYKSCQCRANIMRGKSSKPKSETLLCFVRSNLTSISRKPSVVKTCGYTISPGNCFQVKGHA